MAKKRQTRLQKRADALLADIQAVLDKHDASISGRWDELVSIYTPDTSIVISAMDALGKPSAVKIFDPRKEEEDV